MQLGCRLWGVGLLAMTAGANIGCTAGTHEERAADSATREVAIKMRRHPVARSLRTAAFGAVTHAAAGHGFQYANERTRTSVSLPADAAGPLLLSRHQGSISVQLRGASAASLGGLVDGMVIYPDSIGRGVHSIHRPLPSGGDEELVYFERHPERSSVEYELVAPTGVVGAVNRDGALDLLDRAGRSVFQMRRPFVVGADGKRWEARVATEGCGSGKPARQRLGRCRVVVSWSDAVAYPAVLDPEWEPTGAMTWGRLSHAAVTLPDGRVLVAGGMADEGGGNLVVVGSAEIYHPVTGAWVPTNSMTVPRSGHTAIVMPNGKVLVAGGRDLTSALATAEVFDPTTETWSSVGPMANARSGHDVIEAWNWAPLVAGGAAGGASTLASSEVFDLHTGTWRTVGALNIGRASHKLAELPGKQILAVSGRNQALGWTPTVEIYDPATEVWSIFATLATARVDHTATTLFDGRVLVAGGVASDGSTKLSSVELVDPSGNVAPGPAMAFARFGHTATRLQSGRVLVVGGACDDDTCTEYSEEYDPTLNAWETPTSIHQHPAMRFHTSSLLENGKVINAGGFNFTTLPGLDPTYSTVSLYDAAKCKSPGAVGVVLGSVSAAPAAVDLTAEGETDWLYEIDGYTFNKYGVGLISPFASVGAPQKTTYGSGATTFSWSDGSPDPSRTTDITTGYAGALGDGFSVVLPAAPSLRVARLRLGARSGAGLLRAELNGDACSRFETVVQDPNREVKLLYFSPSASGSLSVRFTLLEAGELSGDAVTMAPAPVAATMFETDLDPTKSAFTVTLDNPEVITNVALGFVPTLWAGGPVAEEVEATPAGFSNFNVDFTYGAHSGEGNPNANGTAPLGAGSVNDTFYSWPNAAGMFSAGTPSATFAGHGRGIRVGYAPLTVDQNRAKPDGSVVTTGSPVTVQLDPNVHLVPIQVVSVYSDTYPSSTRLGEQLAFFDQIHQAETAVIWDGATSERRSTTRGFVALPGSPNFATDWMNAGAQGYALFGAVTPDTAWGGCGIQFRLVNYFEMHVDDKHATPRKKQSADQDDPEYFPSFTQASAPCSQNIGFAQADPRFVANVPVLIYMRRTSFSDSEEDGRALMGSGGACVRRGSRPFAIAHEIGHVMGLDDCGDSKNPTCSIMVSLGGGDVPLPAECTAARTWAQARSGVFR